MNANEAKTGVHKSIEEVWKDKEKAFLDALNDRVSKMALGSLVLIWGLFIGEAHENVSMTKGDRVTLLVVALGSAAVLLVEYIEQWAGYMGAKQVLPGSKVKPYGFPYTAASRRAFYLKHLLGVATIVALIFALGAILIKATVHAQSEKDMKPYIGNWCGSNESGNNWMHLDIEYEGGDPSVSFNWKGKEPKACIIDSVEPNSAEFACEDNTLNITAMPGKDKLTIVWQKNSDPQNQQDLLTCNDHVSIQ